MSMWREWHVWHVVCDACHDPHDDGNWRADEARKAARDDGWHRTQGRDICPECWDEGKR